MNFEDQILFFFSALGAFNGLILSLYFAFLIKTRSKATYFLAALLFVISVRVTKSVFLTFYSGISNSFIQVGLTACLLIGPFLYLYVSEVVNPKPKNSLTWLWHILPISVFMVVIGYFYPYLEYNYLWQRRPNGYLSWLLFGQWLTYIICSIYILKPIIKTVFSKNEKRNGLHFWLVSVVFGVGFIYVAYLTNGYTSYILGALSFSFTFYLLIIIWVFKKKRNTPLFYDNPIKYANKKIEHSKASNLSIQLESLFKKDEIHRNSELKLADVAEKLDIKSHELSQYLNEHVGMSFSNYINSYRVATAEKMLLSNNLLTIQAIGNECGFKSNSTFYTAFKKIKGITPAQFKKAS